MQLKDQKDHFSRALARAVAASAGVMADVPEHDEESVDMTFRLSGLPAALPGRLEAQLKCTASPGFRDGQLVYRLDRKNYDDLRKPSYIPRILIVAHVPSDACDWFRVAHDVNSVVEHCLYWTSLSGLAEVDQTKISVRIPTEQVFDRQSLLDQLRPPGVPT